MDVMRNQRKFWILCKHLGVELLKNKSMGWGISTRLLMMVDGKLILGTLVLRFMLQTYFGDYVFGKNYFWDFDLNEWNLNV